ncbi:MFS transporter [Propioniciclava soli]|uniref:MFS transporter n=1 Tax=Propioniciclava soli TaxID=2775081 RepID=UPI001E36B65D|nr:MFS transporter [Propioniciclava soli]
MTTTLSTRRGTRTKPAWLVIALCWLIVVLDGYDLIVYGTTLPTIMAITEPGWNLNPTEAGFMGSLVFVGALFGALGAGDIADRLGRKKTVLACGLVFTVFTVAIFFAVNKEMFGVFRFLAGIGLGGLVPSANAITAEFVSARKRSFVSTVMMSGIPIGGSIAALLGLVMLPEPGWRTMYALAGVGFVILAVAAWIMPESPSWLRARGREDEARRIASAWGVDHTLEEVVAAHAETPTEAEAGSTSPRPRGLRALFSQRWALASVMFALASIFTLFTWYGLGTWLPKLMGADPHYRTLMFNPLLFLLSLNIGAVIGSVATAWAGVRFGPLKSGIAAAALAALGLAFLLTYPSDPLVANLALVFAGIGTHGTQCLVLAAIASHYPASLRGSALGFGTGMGRIGAITAPILGGALVTLAGANVSQGTSSNFIMFAVAAALAALTLLITLAVSRPTSEKPSGPVIGH